MTKHGIKFINDYGLHMESNFLKCFADDIKLDQFYIIEYNNDVHISHPLLYPHHLLLPLASPPLEGNLVMIAHICLHILQKCFLAI